MVRGLDQREQRRHHGLQKWMLRLSKGTESASVFGLAELGLGHQIRHVEHQASSTACRANNQRPRPSLSLSLDPTKTGPPRRETRRVKRSGSCAAGAAGSSCGWLAVLSGRFGASLCLILPLPQQRSPMNWSAEAEVRLKEIPFFVRPVVRRRIEALASDAGLTEVSESFYEQAKAQFGQN